MLIFSCLLRFVPVLAALVIGYGTLAPSAYAQQQQGQAVDPAAQPMLDTGCRPGDCPKREAVAPTPAEAASAPSPGGTYDSNNRPPPGAFLRTQADGDLRVELTPAKRMPRLWPPIVLTCVGATLLVPAVTMLTIALIDRGFGGDGDPEDTSDVTTVDGLLTLAASAAALTVGVIWLRRRKEARRRIREDEQGPEIALGAQGLGARLTIRM